MKEAEERDRVEMRARLDVWDDDESDELFYTDRARWRGMRGRRLAAEQDEDCPGAREIAALAAEVARIGA